LVEVRGIPPPGRPISVLVLVFFLTRIAFQIKHFLRANKWRRHMPVVTERKEPAETVRQCANEAPDSIRKEVLVGHFHQGKEDSAAASTRAKGEPDLPCSFLHGGSLSLLPTLHIA